MSITSISKFGLNERESEVRGSVLGTMVDMTKSTDLKKRMISVTLELLVSGWVSFLLL